MDKLEAKLLKEIADLDGLPVGAYNIRKNGKSDGRVSTAHIVIDTKTDKSGIDIRIAPGTKKESVHIPVVLTETGLTETVYNDFYVEEGADGPGSVRMHTENLAVARKYFTLLGKTFNIKTDVSIQQGRKLSRGRARSKVAWVPKKNRLARARKGVWNRWGRTR